MAEGKTEVGLPAPEALAQEILNQALILTERFTDLLEAQKETRLQEVFISFTQVLLLGFSSSFVKVYPDRDLSSYENQVFLALARLTLEEILQKEPKENEFEYFLTYYRSHYELLKKDLNREEIPLPEDVKDLTEEVKKRLEELLGRLLGEKRKVCYREEKRSNTL